MDVGPGDPLGVPWRPDPELVTVDQALEVEDVLLLVGREHHRPLDAVDLERGGQPEAAVGALIHAGGGYPNLWVALDIEEVPRAEMPVAWGHPGADAPRLDHDLAAGGDRIVGDLDPTLHVL